MRSPSSWVWRGPLYFSNDDFLGPSLVPSNFKHIFPQAFGLKNGGSFGPEWTCGDFLPTGVWLGLIFGFFFALVVYWGITMLANVETMDRFDDPKGKTIYVPQTE